MTTSSVIWPLLNPSTSHLGHIIGYQDLNRYIRDLRQQEYHGLDYVGN
jgi:hypothetical protein